MNFWKWAVSRLHRRSLSAVALEMSLTVEGCPYDEIPSDLFPAVVSFRHLSRRARLQRCRWASQVFAQETFQRVDAGPRTL